MPDNIEVTCSVCLRKIQLRGDKPIRHGFAAIGVRHGVTQGGYHTGPCEGVDWPHLGISDAGTKHALGISTKRLEHVVKAIERLATHPPLAYHPQFRGKPSIEHAIEVKYGDESVTGTYERDKPSNSRPSYAWLHKQRVDEQTQHAQQIGEQIKAYHKVIDTYSPAKYPTTGAAAKAKTVHLAAPYKNVRYGEWTGPACTRTRGKDDAARYELTADRGKVTCSKCKAK